MEYCSGGELLDRIVKNKHLKEFECCEIMRKLFLAVNYVHKNKIVHRDLKPENILFSDDTPQAELKIVDFGLSNIFINDSKNMNESTTFHSKVGTPLYLAPEILKGSYSVKCDIWSLGVIMYFLLSGKLPFLSNNEASLFKIIKKGIFDFESKEWKSVSTNAKHLILKLLKVNPKKRISAQQALEHPWFELFKTPKTSVSLNGDQIDYNIRNILNNMKTTNRLKKEVLKVFVNRLTEKEILNIKMAFQMIDKEQTGSISCNQLIEVMRNYGLHQSEEEIREIVKKITGIKDLSNELLPINYTDFIAATLDSKVVLNQQKLWNLFKFFDVHDKDCITSADLKEVMARGGRKFPSDEIQKMISESENQQNGKIYFEDFCKMMDVDQVVENQELSSKRNSLSLSLSPEKMKKKVEEKIEKIEEVKNESI